MNNASFYRVQRRSIIAVLVMAVALVGALVAFAQDGRINQVHHFGGDTFFCTDANGSNVNNIGQLGDGGFRVLNLRGEEVWFVPAEVMNAQIEVARTSGQPTIVAEGAGTYGPMILSVVINADGNPEFSIVGVDEHGKTNSLTFTGCEPVGAVGSGPVDSADDAFCDGEGEVIGEGGDCYCDDGYYGEPPYCEPYIGNYIALSDLQ